jgi:hypothetical protein
MLSKEVPPVKTVMGNSESRGATIPSQCLVQAIAEIGFALSIAVKP